MRPAGPPEYGTTARTGYSPGATVPVRPTDRAVRCRRSRRTAGGGADRAAGRGVARQGSSWWSGPTVSAPGRGCDMGVTGPSRCPSCGEPPEEEGAGCGRCGAGNPAPPDPQARIPDAALGGEATGRQPATDPRVAGYEAVADAAEQTPVRGIRRCVLCGAGGVDAAGYCPRCGQAQPRERDHMERELEGVGAVSDIGRRHHRNEDFFTVSATALQDGSPAVVAVVCDGVSSATRPDEASAAACEAAGEALLESLPRGVHAQRAMHDAVVVAAAAVNALAGPDDPQEPRRENAPACTFVGAVVGGGLLTVGWVGDSRAYWVPDDRSVPATRLTEDDSWAAQMIAGNLMSEAEAMADERAHAITGWLGADAYEVEPHTRHFQPDGPGVVVVCTDGLWNYAESAELMAAVLPADAHVRPLESARTLVTHALDGGGHDNITVAVVPFPAPAGHAATA
ncbi:protein phosphatase 2C domain-containing protein [Streptomyces sp. NBC_01525]